MDRFSKIAVDLGFATVKDDQKQWCYLPVPEIRIGIKKNQDMVDISLAFKELVDDFVSSAETEDQFQLFPMIGVAAWNLSNNTVDQREELIKVFIDRFNCPTFIWDNTVIQTREKILELCSRKLRMYPELKQRIISLDIEGMEDGLKYTIVSVDDHISSMPPQLQ
jgi:hypothetical protein